MICNILKGIFISLLLVATTEDCKGQIDDEVRIQHIRDHFYTFNQNIGDYEIFDFDGRTRAYLKDGIPHKITVNTENRQSDYYYNSNQELLFIFEVDHYNENRFILQPHNFRSGSISNTLSDQVDYAR